MLPFKFASHPPFNIVILEQTLSTDDNGFLTLHLHQHYGNCILVLIKTYSYMVLYLTVINSPV